MSISNGLRAPAVAVGALGTLSIASVAVGPSTA
jgi:hypothetical protein